MKRTFRGGCWVRISTVLCLLVCCGLAQAQATRTWVSGVGDDANPCSRTAPCKTFAGAISKTAARGVISVLDPGGFGAVTITKSITIEAEGAIAGVLAAGTNGVVVNAGATDDVVLRGLTFEGTGNGLDGVKILSARSVLLDRCKIEDFSGFAVNATPSVNKLSLSVRDSVFSRNGGASTGGGVQIASTDPGSVSFDFDRTNLFNNTSGIVARGRAGGTIRYSTIQGSSLDGVLMDGITGPVNVMISDSTIGDGAGNGVNAVQVRARILLSGVMIRGNAQGIATSGGIVLSYGDNQVSLNTVDGSPSGTIAPR